LFLSGKRSFFSGIKIGSAREIILFKMKKKIQLLASGIPLVDKTWGGFYRGGTYLLLGPRKSGRTLLGLQFAMESANQKETCLYFTSMRPKDLMIHAASIDFDLQHYMNQNQIIVVRVAPPAELEESENVDEVLSEYLNDIVSVVEQYQPNKVVFDELTPFVSFENINNLHNAFTQTIEKIEEFGISSLIIIGEPATPAARMIVDSIKSNCTGIISLEKKDPEATRLEGGGMLIFPNIGHTEGQFTANYSIEPYKGIIDDYDQKKEETAGKKKFKSLAQLNVADESIQNTNLYPLNEFKLIINNQIALFKTTGQTFNLIVLKLDPMLEKKNLLSNYQLQNAARLAIEKKDKICVLNGKILILFPKSDEKTLNTVLSRLKRNLSGYKTSYQSEILPYIYIYNLAINDNVRHADDLLGQFISEDSPGFTSI
jgi:archaellum biogenesis ATPase FlaH